jgi:hypothetical protein
LNNTVQKKIRGTELAVFKGREAKLNRAIFQSISTNGSQTIYELYKNVRTFSGLKTTHYANVNKRVRSLEQIGYLKKLKTQSTKAGFKTIIYELTNRAYLALVLNAINIDDLLNTLNEEFALQITAIIAEATSKTQSSTKRKQKSTNSSN